MANYDDNEDDDDDFNIYDELTRTESLAVVEDSINVFAKVCIDLISILLLPCQNIFSKNFMYSFISLVIKR